MQLETPITPVRRLLRVRDVCALVGVARKSVPRHLDDEGSAFAGSRHDERGACDHSGALLRVGMLCEVAARVVDEELERFEAQVPVFESHVGVDRVEECAAHALPCASGELQVLGPHLCGGGCLRPWSGNSLRRAYRSKRTGGPLLAVAAGELAALRATHSFRWRRITSSTPRGARSTVKLSSVALVELTLSLSEQPTNHRVVRARQRRLPYLVQPTGSE